MVIRSGMRSTRRRRGSHRRRAVLLALTAVGLAVGVVPTSANGQVACTITSADAFFYSDTPRADVVTYYGQVMMYTANCGLSPAEVQATFRPVAGTPSTCDFKGTLFSDYAMCRGAQGVASPGTQVVIEAVGRTYGSGGADLFTSSCVVIVTPLPAGDGIGTSASRSSCPLPLS